MGVNVAQVLRHGARTDPGRVAVTDASDGRSWTFGELDAAARGVARTLRDRGLGPGTRVGLCAANGVPFLATWFGVLYAGGTVVPVPILSAPPELAFRLRHAGCAALVVDPARGALARKALAELPNAPVLLDAADLATAVPADLPPVDTRPDHPAMILYTSGTTGTPKGAVITHASLMTHTAALVTHTLGFDAETVVLCALPLTHSFGIRMAILAPFYAGGRALLVPRFDAAQTLELVETAGVTWLPGVPTMFAAWANVSGGPPQPASLRWALSAGAPKCGSVPKSGKATA